jgi:adenine-specific DNA methylase
VRFVEARVAEAVRSFLAHVLYVEPSYNYKEYSKGYIRLTVLQRTVRFALYEVAKRYLRIRREDAVHAVNTKYSSSGHLLM